MNPLGVLTAFDVMEPGEGSDVVDAETPIRDLLPRLSDGPLSVMRDGTHAGRVSADSILARLAKATQA